MTSFSTFLVISFLFSISSGDVNIGGANRNSIGLGLNFLDPFMRTLKVPQHAIGTIGNPVFIARITPPFLKGFIVPSNVLVPSGNINIERGFFLSEFLILSNDLRALS